MEEVALLLVRRIAARVVWVPAPAGVIVTVPLATQELNEYRRIVQDQSDRMFKTNLGEGPVSHPR